MFGQVVSTHTTYNHCTNLSPILEEKRVELTELSVEVLAVLRGHAACWVGHAAVLPTSGLGVPM